jgi:predicted small lipoprotein YifL
MTVLAIAAIWLLVVLLVLSLCLAAGGRRGPSGVR